MRLGTILLGWDLVEEDVLLDALSRIHRCPAVGWPELSRAENEVAGLLPAAAARTLRAMPYGWSGRSLQVAFVNPSDLKVVDEVAALLRRRILPAVTTEIRILQSHQLYYGYGISADLKPILFKLDRRTRTKALASIEPADRMPFRGTTYPQEIEPNAAEAGPPPAPEAAEPFSAEPLSAEPGLLHEFRSETAVSAAPAHPVPAPEPQVEEVSDAAEEDGGEREAGSGSGTGTADPAIFAAPNLWLEAPVPQEPAPGEGAATGASGSRSPREMADALLKALLSDFQRVAILRAGRRGISGWGQRGRSVLTDHFVEVRIPWSVHSVFSDVRRTAVPHFGPLRSDLWPGALSAILGGAPPPCAIFPVLVGDRVAAFLYADRIGAPLQQHDHSLLSRAASAAAALLSTVELEDSENDSYPEDR